MYSSTSPLSLSALVLALALALDSHTVSALPVPAAANSIVLSPVQRSLPATTAPFLVSRKVRRSITPLHLVDSDDQPGVLQSLVADMRDPHNWLEAASSSSSSTAAPVLAPSKRDRVLSSKMPMISDSIFPDVFSGADSDDATSLEPNGIHASLAAAMAVRQLEQRQTPPPLQTRFVATFKPASAKVRSNTETDAAVRNLLPASESGRMVDHPNRMNPSAA